MIEIQNVSKHYGEKVVLENINIHLKENNCLCIVGKNGAGKSTLLNIITDLIHPTTGKVLLLGKEYANESLFIKSRIGVVLQDSILLEDLTGIEYLKFVNLLFKEYKKNIVYDELIELFNFFFDDIKDGEKKVALYSTGMKQKLAFCAALINKPDILILDEPFLGLDILSTKLISDFLKEYTKNRCIIFSSNNLNNIENIATHIGIIDNANVIYYNTINVFTNNGNNTIESKLYNILKEDSELNKDFLGKYINKVSDD